MSMSIQAHPKSASTDHYDGFSTVDLKMDGEGNARICLFFRFSDHRAHAEKIAEAINTALKDAQQIQEAAE